MIDFSRIQGFDWDAGNARKSADKHGVDPMETEQVFLDERVLILPDLGHSAEEPRFNALGGTLTGRLLHVTFTLRRGGTLLRVISARDMSRKEKNSHGQT